jgi:hypothetical protein
MFKKKFSTGMLLFCTLFAAAQNNVGIGTANPVSLLDVRGNGINYDPFNASNDKQLPLDSIVSISSFGNLGIGTTNTGTYKLVSMGNPSAFSPQIELWNGNPNAPASALLGDLNDAGGNTGALNLYAGGLLRNVQLRATGISYFNGGNVGIGQLVPQETLHLNGALILGLHVQIPPNEVPGTIEWDGFNFRGFNGTTWINLDAQNVPDNDWLIQVSGYQPPPPNAPPSNPELVPMMPPASLSMSLPGDPNQGGIVWIPDRPLPMQYPHQLMLESTTNLATDASMRFRMSNWAVYVPEQTPPLMIDDYSLGIFRTDMCFKLYRGSILATTTQGDAFSMWRSHPSGIYDLPNQSRVRADVTLIDWGSWQLIPPTAWTPVNFTNPIIGFNPPVPYPPGMLFWDEQGEFTPAAVPNQVIIPDALGNPIPNAWFMATEEGYYQVNARCEFETDEYISGTPPVVSAVFMRPNAYVSIAVYIELAGGGVTWLRFSTGNNLQVTNNVTIASPPPEFPDATGTMSNNNAPNVSDVVYLNPGDRVSIWVFHWAYTPMMLRVGDDVLYFSIHKIS